MAQTPYKILAVSKDGLSMSIEWSEFGVTMGIPVPLDGNGDALSDAALDDALYERYAPVLQQAASRKGQEASLKGKVGRIRQADKK